MAFNSANAFNRQPRTAACQHCGGAEFTWGVLRTPGKARPRFFPHETSFLKKLLSLGYETEQRVCNDCGAMVPFLTKTEE